MKHFHQHRSILLPLCGLLLAMGGQGRADDLISVHKLALLSDPQYQAAGLSSALDLAQINELLVESSQYFTP